MPGAAARARTRGAPPRGLHRPGPLPDRRPPPSSGRGLPARTHPCRSRAPSSASSFFASPLSRSQVPTRPQSHTPSTDHAQHTFSHLYSPASTRSCYRALGTVATAGKALAGHGPSAQQALLVGAQRAAGAGPRSAPRNWPRRSQVRAGPVLRQGRGLEPYRQRGGAGPASESKPKPRIQGARLGRASWGNCCDGQDSASSSPRSQRTEA